MDLYIHTLTGTAFQLRVSPFETIMSIKAKIQRLEGIPVSQQHLIWRSVELIDDFCLHDYNICDGATLQLVLAMRGGPINTRRVPMEDPSLQEMAEYMEANQDEIWDRLPKDNRQVTLLVFRDGDQLNFFRVVDRGDGTLTPLSDSLSGASMYNLYDEEEEDSQKPVSQETMKENKVTMNKMKLLRHKLESQKLTKPEMLPQPPPAEKPKTGIASARRRSDEHPQYFYTGVPCLRAFDKWVPKFTLIVVKFENGSSNFTHRHKHESVAPPHHLPPVKTHPPQLVQSKKKTRCFFCGKKTGLATTFQCRCGNTFCATHRYAEVHGCTYDYKSEGRKLIEQNNPVVAAPKLPKI
ncbi:hypothetical protein QZH41_012926 [Actinostola sp. cb2023]|nr:hypothetical protein QZH41_012926 [Actinostola sp. cb2023]